MTDTPTGTWWRHGVFYQIYPRSFQDSNADGVGDLRGIIARLDHLTDLGVDAMWLSPFYRSPMEDFGYDVSDYTDVDPSFGTLADFDRLLSESHARGLRVIVDLVPNHTSSQHQWFVEARATRDNPKRDWYIWADPNPDGAPPNNWRSVFKRAGAAWTLDRGTGQYYLHSFLSSQPDLNWWNQDVRDAMDAVMRFWLERGVDGFRIDVAHGMIHDRELRDEPRVKFARATRRRMQFDRPEVLDVHRRFRKTLDDYGDRMAVAEIGYRPDPRYVAGYSGHDLLHLSFNFAFLRQPWRAETFRRVAENAERYLPPDAWPNYTLSNHDVPRAISRYGDGEARVAALMLLTMRGTPFIYYGEEIGMHDLEIPRRRQVDVADRDRARTPMQWDGTPTVGFTTGTPWLPVGKDRRTANVARERTHTRSILSLYRQILALRRRSPALHAGAYRTVRAPEGVWAYMRESADERWLVALNFRSRARRLDLSRVSREGVLALSTGLDRDRGVVDLRELKLEPDEGVLVRIR
ncbi:MAG: DUF3459 domain-containing protein [Chloroflexi bacterium]|nr:MAG: DUF3459 domain-containing protein [Chloroflexota bacterium]